MGGGGQVGCERRIEVFVKIQKKFGGWVVGKRGGDQGRCERRSEVFVKIQNFGVGQFGGGGGGYGLGVGVRVDVNGEVKFL